MKNSVKVFNTFNNMLKEVERTHFDFTNGVLAITIFGGFKVNQKAVIIKDDPSLSPEKQLKATHKAQSAIIKRMAAYFKAKAKCDRPAQSSLLGLLIKPEQCFVLRHLSIRTKH